MVRSSRSVGRLLAGVALVAGLAVPTAASAQEEPEGFPLDLLLDDTRRTLVVEAIVGADDGVTVVDTFVTDVPPAGHLAVPPQLRLEAFDRDGATLADRNAWNPRLELEEDEDGRHVEVTVEGEVGEFQVPFDATLGSVRISDPATSQTLATVDVRVAVSVFCTEQPEDLGCADFEPGDIDGDGVLDGEDNCPFIPNLDQEDVLGRGVGDACARPGNFDGNAHVDVLDLLEMWYRGFNQPTTGPGYDLTPMDMNGDGLMNVLDVRKVILLCDLASCQIVE